MLSINTWRLGNCFICRLYMIELSLIFCCTTFVVLIFFIDLNILSCFGMITENSFLICFGSCFSFF